MGERQVGVDGSLAGRQILVVEDEFILAEEMAETLRSVGADVVGSAHTVKSALDLIHASPWIDAAIIDVNLAGEMAFPVVDALIEIDRPYIFSTVWRPGQIPLKYRAAPHCAKPTLPAKLLRSLQSVLEEHRSFAPTENDQSQSSLQRFSAVGVDQTSDWLRAIALDQDINAFKSVFETLGPKVKQYFLSRGSDAASAEELVQEVMVTVWARAHQFVPTHSSGQAWVFTLARNSLVDGGPNRRRSEKVTSFSTVPSQLFEAISLHASPRAGLGNALKQLPREDADLLKFSFLTTRPYWRSGMASEDEKSRLCSILSRLRSILEGPWSS